MSVLTDANDLLMFNFLKKAAEWYFTESSKIYEPRADYERMHHVH